MDSAERKRELNHHYMPDRTTMMERRAVVPSSSRSQRPTAKLQRQVLRVIDRLLNLGDPAPNTNTIQLPPEPDLPVLDGELDSEQINYEYVHDRLGRSIEQADRRGDQTEALRLNRLLYLLERGEIRPIKAARYAWLKPAAREIPF